MIRVASPTFVGRDVELSALDDALNAAVHGQTTTVLIGGDPGVGKTRLLQSWNERAVRRGARIAAGSCLDLGETGPAYVAVAEALRDLLAGLDLTAEERLVGPDRTALARIVPEFGAEPELDAIGREGPGLGQTRLFDRLADVFERAAVTGPVIVELEDIHWADRSSQAFLLYLVEVSRTANLLLIGTYRPEVAETDQAFATTLGQLLRRPRVVTMPLAPFDEDELRKQLTGILGAPPSTYLLSAIHARSEGNALFAEELAAAGDPRVHLPASIAAATATKVAGLSEDARAVLRIASVVGRAAGYDVLREASGLEDEPLARALRETVRARFLEPHHVGEQYRFRHELLQDAIYQETLPGERRRLHAIVARALSADPDRPPEDAAVAPRLARHWFEAGDFERAFLASLAAATAAERQSAYAEAATHLERALDLWDRAGDAPSGVSRADTLERAAWAAFLAGDFDRSAVLAGAALDELGPTPDRSHLIRVLDLLSRAEGRAGVDAPAAMAALAALDSQGLAPADRIFVESYRALVLDGPGRLREALEIARPLVAEAHATGSFRVHAHAARVLAIFLHWIDPVAALDLLDPLRTEAAALGDDVYRTDLEVTSSRIMLDAGLYDRLVATVPDALEFAGRTGLGRWARPELRYNLAHGYLLLGQLAQSLEQVDLAGMDLPTGRIRALLETVGALAATATGAYGAAAEHLEASRLPNATPEAELGRGFLATARAQLAFAERRFDDVQRIVEATAPRVLASEGYTAMTDTIWSMAEVGLAAVAEQVERARAAGDAAVGHTLAAVTVRIHGWVDEALRQREGAGLQALGEQAGNESMIAGHIARIEGRDEPGLWAAAAKRFPERSVEALTARYRQAEAMLAARIPREDVRSVIVDAHASAVDIGAMPLSGRFEALARRARIALGAADAPAGPEELPGTAREARSPGNVALRKRGLSDREIEVLTLVAAGFSNAEIGNRLFISAKTASVHVTHILGKLDVSTRTEAATIGVRLGLPEVDTAE
jgi:DNA-binding CsgD family transcriptional regulator/tetratricopeptide (TPR) repeat protein